VKCPNAAEHKVPGRNLPNNTVLLMAGISELLQNEKKSRQCIVC
jgi:hypothetical protein